MLPLLSLRPGAQVATHTVATFVCSLLLAPGAAVAADELSTIGTSTVTHTQLGDTGAEDSFGHAVASGDFDGDGYLDIAIGDPHDDTTVTDGGSVHIVYGSATGPDPGDDQTLRQGNGGVRGSLEAGDRFGETLTVGNFDGDAYDDLAVGSPGEAVGATVGAGTVLVFYGSATGLRTDNEDDWNQNSSGVSGSSLAGDALGSALAAGDFDNDGYDDLAIGVPWKDTGAPLNTNGGLFFVFPGSGSGLISNEDVWEQGFNGLSESPGFLNQLGASLAAGDFDGDGYDDLAIGAPGETVSALSGAGALHILEGSATGLPTTCAAPTSNCTISADAFWTQVGAVLGAPSSNAAFGSSLVACDFNGDGRDDLAVGFSLSDASGIVQSHPGSAGGLVPGNDQWQQGFNVAGTSTPGDRFGDSLACGDFDADGHADLAIATALEDELSTGSSVTEGGHIDVIYGSASSSSATGLNGGRAQSWDHGQPEIGSSPAANDRWATGLAIGDFDGNGHDDLAVGMVPFSNDGAVDVIFGGLDTDGDGLSNVYETATSLTNPVSWSSDLDEFGDGAEHIAASDPNDFESVPFFSEAAALNSNASTDDEDDEQPYLATTGSGTWVAVWATHEDFGGSPSVKRRIVMSRSGDNGASWSPVQVVEGTDQAGFNTHYFRPRVALDGAGNCVVVFLEEVPEIGALNAKSIRSTDYCATFPSPSVFLSMGQDTGVIPADTEYPSIATDGSGTFVVAGIQRSNDIQSILVSRSTNGGLNWSSPLTNLGTVDNDLGDSVFMPSVETDRAGNWIVAWGGDTAHRSAVSTNNATTWTTHAAAGGEFTSDGSGNWIRVRTSSSPPNFSDSDIAKSISTDLGTGIWTADTALNTNAATDAGDDIHPRITTDGLNWLTLWESDEPIVPALGQDRDVLFSISSDTGSTWSAPAAVNLYGIGADGDDTVPHIVTDGLGHWVAAWRSEDDLDGTLGSDGDIVFATASGPDTDGDGLYDGLELNLFTTDPLLADTDGDGLDDTEELFVHLTNPLDADTDDDGLSDGAEILAGTDPLDPESPMPPKVPMLPTSGLVGLTLLLSAAGLGRLRSAASQQH